MKIYLCDNPYQPNTSDNLILTLEPSLLLTARLIDSGFEVSGEVVFYINREYGMLEIYDIRLLKNFDSVDEDEVRRCVGEVAGWWEKYLLWEDNNTDEDDLFLSPKDFIPGKNIKVLVNSDETKYAVIYAGMVRGFDTQDEVMSFLRNVGLSDEEIANGCVNRVDVSDIGLN